MNKEHAKLVRDVLQKAFRAAYAHGEYPYDFEWGLAFKALDDELADQPAPTETARLTTGSQVLVRGVIAEMPGEGVALVRIPASLGPVRVLPVRVALLETAPQGAPFPAHGCVEHDFGPAFCWNCGADTPAPTETAPRGAPRPAHDYATCAGCNPAVRDRGVVK